MQRCGRLVNPPSSGQVSGSPATSGAFRDKTPQVEVFQTCLERLASTLTGAQKTEFIRTAFMLRGDQQTDVSNMKPKDVAHYLVFAMAIRAGYRRVEVCDISPKDWNIDTFFISEAQIAQIGKKFMEAKAPSRVTGTYVMQWERMHAENKPLNPNANPEGLETALSAFDRS
jgi:hypothetical protein